MNFDLVPAETQHDPRSYHDMPGRAAGQANIFHLVLQPSHEALAGPAAMTDIHTQEAENGATAQAAAALEVKSHNLSNNEVQERNT